MEPVDQRARTLQAVTEHAAGAPFLHAPRQPDAIRIVEIDDSGVAGGEIPKQAGLGLKVRGHGLVAVQMVLAQIQKYPDRRPEPLGQLELERGKFDNVQKIFSLADFIQKRRADISSDDDSFSAKLGAEKRREKLGRRRLAVRARHRQKRSAAATRKGEVEIARDPGIVARNSKRRQRDAGAHDNGVRLPRAGRKKPPVGHDRLEVPAQAAPEVRGESLESLIESDEFRPALEFPDRRKAGEAEAQNEDAVHQRNFRLASATSADTIPRIQNRMTILDSAQPDSSKWWCRGDMRKTRCVFAYSFPRRHLFQRYTAVWISTERVSATNIDPASTRSSSCLIRIATAPRMPPMVSAPVSPRKTSAGGALNQRNPRRPPSMPARTTVISPAPITLMTCRYRLKKK